MMTTTAPLSADWSQIREQLLETLIILERPMVQLQILVMVMALILSWLLVTWAARLCHQQFPSVGQFGDVNLQGHWHNYLFAMAQVLSPILLAQLILHGAKVIFRAQGLLTGLLNDGIYWLGLYGLYCFFLAILYIYFPTSLVTYYRHNFFSPLVILFIIGQILNIFLDLPLFLNVSFIDLFGAPINLGSILVIVGGIYFWTIGSSLIEKFITNILLYNLQQDPNIRQVVGLIIRYFLMGLGIVIIFGYVGFSPTALAAITGGLSVGIGFGLKEIISNFVSGIWLLFEGVLKPGDVIIIDGEMSEVKKLGVRATTVQVVRDNSEQIIPNQTFFTQTMTTLTGSDRLSYRSLSVGASYACDPQQVIKVLLQVADHHPRVLKLPPPIAFLVGFGDSSLNFELKFWLDEPLTGKRTISELSCHIWQAFAEAGIEIPFPQQDVHIDYPSSNS